MGKLVNVIFKDFDGTVKVKSYPVKSEEVINPEFLEPYLFDLMEEVPIIEEKKERSR